MHYQLYHNQDAWFSRGYEPGDVLKRGYAEDFPPCFRLRTDMHPSEAMLGLCETIFVKHNRDDRPDGQTAPSLSVGDVIQIGEVAFTVERFGFTQVSLYDAIIFEGATPTKP